MTLCSTTNTALHDYIERAMNWQKSLDNDSTTTEEKERDITRNE